MATIDVDFDWPRAFTYELATSKGQTVIRQTVANTERIWPLRLRGTLYLDFARLDGTPEGCLNFARRWGFLGFPDKSANGLPTPPRKGAEEEIENWRDAIKFMNLWLRSLSGDLGSRLAPGLRSRTKVTSVDVLIAEEPNAPRALVLRPRSLLDALQLQLAQSLGSGKEIRTCPQCGGWFEAGAEGKRTIAKFCSDKCRNQFHRRAKQ